MDTGIYDEEGNILGDRCLKEDEYRGGIKINHGQIYRKNMGFG